jgi:hypothetical protein
MLFAKVAAYAHLQFSMVLVKKPRLHHGVLINHIFQWLDALGVGKEDPGR